MVEPEVVRQLRELKGLGWGDKRIAKELGLARNTVRRYARGAEPGEQTRPRSRALDAEEAARAKQLFTTTAEGNAVVVASELRRDGLEVSVRTVQRAVRDERLAKQVAEVATVRYETAPGRQMQIDFGQKRVSIAGVVTVVHVLVAVLGYSRRIFVQAFLAERGDDWREGVASAFEHFGGVTRELLIDNARALVVARDRATQVVTLHPAFASFCRDWNVVPRACAPYRARTKGKTESGVKYVKRNALAGRAFANFAALEAHLADWMGEADARVHGTTHEAPRDRFERDERQALAPLRSRPSPVREQRLGRRVGNDAFVNVDTVRYSVPHRFVREHVEVLVGETHVRVFRGAEVIAEHERSREPHAIVREPKHFEGLWRATNTDASPKDGTVETYGRSLRDYAELVEAAS
jgi:transposase